MQPNRCQICLRPTKTGDNLCEAHTRVYAFDDDIKGFRLKKINNGTSTRYVQKKYHAHEISLTKIVEKFYGPKQVITGYHPLWAVSKKGALLEFDIAIPSRKILIEYNGEQHYHFVATFHKTKTKFVEQQRRDKRKAKLAKKHDYTLIVFKFNEPLFEDYIINKIEGTINDNIN